MKEKFFITGETYFITDGNSYSWNGIAEIIQKKLGKRYVIRINYPALIAISTILSFVSKMQGKATSLPPERVAQIRKIYWIYDVSKAERELGFKAKVNIYDGIREAVNDYLKEKLF